MAIAGDVMSRPLLSVDGGCRVADAIRFARDHGIEHLAVTEGDDVIGLVPLFELEGAAPEDEVREHAGPPVEAVAPSTPADRLAELLSHAPGGCVPVAAGGLLLGVVTRSDLEASAA